VGIPARERARLSPCAGRVAVDDSGRLNAPNPMEEDTMQHVVNRRAAALALALLALTPIALAEEASETASAKSDKGAKNAEAWDGDPYLLDFCPVTGQKLGSMGDPAVVEVDGREVRLCCAGCESQLRADPAGVLEKADQAIAKEQRPRYPLTTCVVGGGDLDAMGGPVELVHKNRLVRLCCAGCIGKFEDDPASYIAKLNDAVVEDQKADYPQTVCVVSGKPLDAMGEPVDKVVAGRLVRLCCPACVEAIEAAPAEHLSKLDATD